MMWRASRPSRVREGVVLPYAGEDGAVVGAMDLAALRELSVWRRLVRTSLPDVPLRTLLIADAWSPKARRTAEAAFAPSEMAGIEFVADPEGRWLSALGLEGGEATFAALVKSGVASCLVLGGPADEAWDRLEAAASDFR
jgi:hypothetical protein